MAISAPVLLGLIMNRARARSAYYLQTYNAKRKGIQMRFTFDEWIEWWHQHLGPDWQSKRGCNQGQYVMARTGDKCHYELSNVRCALVGDNHTEHNLNRITPTGLQRQRLTKAQVIGIFKADDLHVNIAKRFGCGTYQVHCVKTKKYYRDITDKL